MLEQGNNAKFRVASSNLDLVCCGWYLVYNVMRGLFTDTYTITPSL